MNSHLVKHLDSKQGESGTEERSKYGVGSEDGGGIDGVTVDEVTQNGQENDNDTATERHTEDDRGNPVDIGTISGSSTGKTDDNEDTTPHGGRKSVFRVSTAALLLRNLDILRVGDEDGQKNRKNGADENTEESETTDTSVPAVAALENDGVGGEEEVEDAVDQGLFDVSVIHSYNKLYLQCKD